jgi:hypothetical protein
MEEEIFPFFTLSFSLLFVILNQKSSLIKKTNKMDAQTVDLFLMANSKYLEDHQMYLIRDRLIAMDESKWRMLQFMQFNDPVIILIVSLITGPLAIDRFMIGDTGLGVLKLITCGGLGIWMLVDWVIIMGITRRKNTEKLMMAIY